MTKIKVERVRHPEHGGPGISLSADLPPDATDEQKKKASDDLIAATRKVLGIPERPQLPEGRAKKSNDGNE